MEVSEIQMKVVSLPTGSVYVRSDGVVLGNTGEITPIVGENDTLMIQTKDRTEQVFQMPLAELVLLAFEFFDTPILDVLKKIEILYADGDKTNCKFDNLAYRFIGGPLASSMYGYFHIPFFTKYLINRDGKVLSLYTCKEKLFSTVTTDSSRTEESSYLKTRLIRDSGKEVSIGLHRLIALTFIEYPPNVHYMIINHKDADTTNNKVSNLEWCTHKENNQHAYDTGIRNFRKEVERVNVVTGERVRYNSISHAAKENHYHFTAAMAKRVATKTLSDDCYFKFAEDPDSDPSTLKVLAKSKPVVVKNLRDGTIRSYSTIAEACNETLVIPSTLSYMLRHSVRRPSNGFVFAYSEQELPCFSPDEVLAFLSTSKNMQGPVGNAVKITMLNGETKFYPTVAEAARQMNLRVDTMHAYIKSKGKSNAFTAELIQGQPK